MNIVITVWTLVLAVYLLVKNSFPSVKRIILYVILAVLASIAYLGISSESSIVFGMLMAGVSTFICSMAVCSVMEKYGEFSLLRTEKVSSIFISILIGIGTGAVLSVINYFLAKGSGNSLDFKISFNRILVALNPGIYEEIACRAIFRKLLNGRFLQCGL